MIKFNILFDNYNYDENLQSLWGFSCLIEIDNRKILFDTGSNGRVLLQNAKKMDIDFKDIDTIFISHTHWDHIGGVDTIIEENPNITLIIPSSISQYWLNDLKELVDNVVVIEKDFKLLSYHLYTTGLMSDVREQALVIEYKSKLYIVTGCGHAGIENIEEKVLKHIKKPVKYILGGFHLMKKSSAEIQETIKKIDTEYITATHCSGDKAIGMLKLQYKDKFLNGGAGAIIEF